MIARRARGRRSLECQVYYTNRHFSGDPWMIEQVCFYAATFSETEEMRSYT
jgi:hypothetical protein